jgi:hypothetical protein
MNQPIREPVKIGQLASRIPISFLRRDFMKISHFAARVRGKFSPNFNYGSMHAFINSGTLQFAI